MDVKWPTYTRAAPEVQTQPLPKLLHTLNLGWILQLHCVWVALGLIHCALYRL